MNHRHRILLAVAVLALARTGDVIAAAGPAEEIPARIRYERAAPEAVKAATNSLRAALAAGPEALAKLFGPHDTRANATLAGPFLGIHIASLELDVSKYFGVFNYNLPAQSSVPRMEAQSVYAESAERQRLLAQLVHQLAKADEPGEFRAPTYDELALVWYWIEWDLAGPLLVYQTAHEKLMFDFDASGRITWIERLTDPCVTGRQEDRQVMSCQCMVVRRKREEWNIVLEPKPACEAIGVMSLADKLMASATPAEKNPDLPAIAYVRIGTHARVDEMLIDSYRPDHALFRLPAGYPGYQGVGKLLSGAVLRPVLDAAGEKIHGYVLLASIVNGAGRLVANRALLFTDARLAESAIKSADNMVVEAAKMRGNPVPEAIWQQIPF